MRSLSPVLLYSRRTYTDRYTSHATVRSRHKARRACYCVRRVHCPRFSSTDDVHTRNAIRAVKRPTLMCAHGIGQTCVLLCWMRSLSPVLLYSRRTYTHRYTGTSHAAVRSRHRPDVRAIVLDAFIVLGSPLSTTYIHGSLYVHVPSIKRPTLLCARSILSVLLYLMAIVSTVRYVGRNTFTHHTLSISERVPLCWLSIVASSSVLAKHACILQLVCYDGSV